MSITAIIISIVYLLCLTGCSASCSVGLIRPDDKPSQRYLVPLIFAATQGIMALLGMLVGKAITYLFDAVGHYLVFVMMLVVAVKLMVDAIQILKGKRLYTFTSDWGFLLLSIVASINTFLMALMSDFFLPFGNWFFLFVAVAGFLWSYFTVKIQYSPKVMRIMSFFEFSESVFMAVIAVLFMFTNLLA